MKKTILLLLWSCLSFSQDIEKDSVLKNIEAYRKKDTIKVNMIVDYCVAKTFSNSVQVLHLANEAYSLSEQLNYRAGKMQSLNCIGNYYYQQAIYNKATKFYTMSLAIAEKHRDNRNIVIGKSNLGSVYTRTQQPKKALALLKDADRILLATGKENSQNRAALLTNIGALYSSINQHSEAIQYHEKTLEICEKQNIAIGIAIACSNIGEEYVALKKYDAAFVYLLRGKSLSEKENFDNFLGHIYKNIGIVLWHDNKKDEALKYLKKAVAISEKINGQNELIGILDIQQQFYAEISDYKSAYETGLRLKNLNERVNGIEQQKAISDISAKYETEKKQGQILSLRKDNQIVSLQNKRQKIVMVLLSLGIISIVGFSYFIFTRYKIKKHNELLRTKLLETEKTILAEKKASESELRALKSQMNPHFFFNALNTIQSYITTNETDEATDYLNKFSKLTRMILEMAEKDRITIAEELRMQKLYLNLQKIRLSEFDFEVNISQGSLNAATLPTMLLQPYIENAVIHGLSHKIGDKKLWLDFKNSNDELIILIKDNGVGLEKAAEINKKNKNKNTSFATKATLERLEIINRDNMRIAVETNEIFDNKDHSQGTEVKITMDLRYE